MISETLISELQKQDDKDRDIPADPGMPETGTWISGLQKQDPVISFLKGVSLISKGSQRLGDTDYTTRFNVSPLYGLDAGDTIFITGAQAERLSGLYRVNAVAADYFEAEVPFDLCI